MLTINILGVLPRASFMTGLYPDQTNIKKLRVYLRQTLPKVVTIGQRAQARKLSFCSGRKIFHYHNPRDIGTAGHDDNYTWDQTAIHMAEIRLRNIK